MGFVTVKPVCAFLNYFSSSFQHLIIHMCPAKCGSVNWSFILRTWSFILETLVSIPQSGRVWEATSWWFSLTLMFLSLLSSLFFILRSLFSPLSSQRQAVWRSVSSHHHALPKSHKFNFKTWRIMQTFIVDCPEGESRVSAKHWAMLSQTCWVHHQSSLQSPHKGCSAIAPLPHKNTLSMLPCLSSSSTRTATRNPLCQYSPLQILPCLILFPIKDQPSEKLENTLFGTSQTRCANLI